jgi:histidinol-phosphate phosphatase family protein
MPSSVNRILLTTLRGALFLDRDGVLNRHRPDHVKSWSEFEFLPGVLKALAEVGRMNIPVVIDTNQSAVGRGLITSAELDRIHTQMVMEITKQGGRIDGVYVCVHTREEGCSCRKPGSDLFLRARANLGLHLGSSIMVGDALTDVQAALRVGCQPILVAAERPTGLLDNVPVAEDLREAIAIARRFWYREPAQC